MSTETGKITDFLTNRFSLLRIDFLARKAMRELTR